MKKTKESKAMLEVWQWKDEAYREVAHLPIKDAIRKRIEDCVQIDRSMRKKRAK